MAPSAPGRDAAPTPERDDPPAHGRGATARLQADQLVVIRGERLVLDGLGLACHDGEALLLTGPNGAGKSTLLRILAGLRTPDSGTVLWDGEPIAEDPAAHARRTAYLGHLDALKPGLTLAENLRLAAITGGGDLAGALAALGLSPLHDLPARLLSAGQKRRAALARILLLRARLWLLDEPSLGLDRQSIGLLGAMLARHRAAGGLVIATTHVALPLPGARSLSLHPAPEGPDRGGAGGAGGENRDAQEAGAKGTGQHGVDPDDRAPDKEGSDNEDPGDVGADGAGTQEPPR